MGFYGAIGVVLVYLIAGGTSTAICEMYLPRPGIESPCKFLHPRAGTYIICKNIYLMCKITSDNKRLSDVIHNKKCHQPHVVIEIDGIL